MIPTGTNYHYQLGSHFIVGLEGTVLTVAEASLLSQLRPLGIILFSHNIDRASPCWPEKLRRLIQDAKLAAHRSDFIVSIDHEGGKVHRLCPPITHFPAAWDWNSDSAEVGKCIGTELHALGININFAPVLDIFLEPSNQVIGKRALADNPERVAELSIAYIRGQESAGVVACGKHFPGHGATIKDSHFELPVLELSLDTLRQRELIPFRRAIDAGLSLMMTAHVMFPQLDPKFPVTLSKKIITELLRNELGFSGCVISDALEMKALSGFSDNMIPKCAMEAGVDILLVAKPEVSPPVLRAIEIAQALNQVDSNQLAASKERIDRFMAHLSKIVLNAEPAQKVFPYRNALLERLSSRG